MFFIVLCIHEHLQWDCNSGFGWSGQWPHKLIIPPDVIFMFSSCTRGLGGMGGYFPKCLLLISAGQKSRLWREFGVTCQSKPAETRWVPWLWDQLTAHWAHSSVFLILITFSKIWDLNSHTIATVALNRHIDTEWNFCPFSLVSFCSVCPTNNFFHLMFCQSPVVLNAGYWAVKSYFTAALSNELK